MAGSVGFIGLGRMGRPMVTNLLRKGFRVPARERLSLARARGWGGKDFSALPDALCERCGAPPVRFAPVRHQF